MTKPRPVVPARWALLLTATLAGCVAPPAPSPAPPPPAATPAPAPAPVPEAAAGWEDAPLTPGTWRYQRDAGGSAALFGEAGGVVRLSLRCDRAGNRLILARPVAAAATGMTIRTSYGAAQWSATPGSSGAAQAEAARATNDPVFDQIAFSRGRFAVEAGGDRVIAPNWAEIARVVEDCRP